MKSKWSRLIVALDVEDKDKILKVVTSLSEKVGKFKIGLIAFSKFGPLAVALIRRRKLEVFLDLKFYDIPNTMKRAARIAARLGVWAFTVHAKSGQQALEELKKDLVLFCRKNRLRRPLIIGVTELTSTASSRLKVLRLAGLCHKAGLDGVVCSAREASLIKRKYKSLKVITPGIRPARSRGDDQKRITTASQAFNDGADYIVVGRPIIEQKDYLKAAGEVLSF
jgi:orotidine-5'-phosphate decarboxylase